MPCAGCAHHDRFRIGMECSQLGQAKFSLLNLVIFKIKLPKFRLSPYKMYGAYWSNAEQKVQVPIEFQCGNPGSALPGMSSACCIDIHTGHHGPQKFSIQTADYSSLTLF